ncbi:MAG: acetate--CoA ligase family protein [Deltaproteobacteria bacterium]|nr:acetate--CoA ligase family protein [Deltaproteobacteria bacterium]
MADLSSLFSPRSIAIIGASERGHYASSLLQNLSLGGFPREAIYPVNPRYREIFGLPCYPTVKEIPGPVDLAVVIVPVPLVLPVTKDCGSKGVRALSVISMGFAEAGEEGRKLQEELSSLARDSGMLVLGPNTLGHVSIPSGALTWCTSLPGGLRRGGLAAIFHSSGMLNLFFTMVAQRGLGFSLGVAPGNEAILNMSDYLDWAVEDAEIRVIALVIESVREPRKFRAALERAGALRKPVVVLRLGRSARAKRSILSHTGSLATTGEAWDAFFGQSGVVGVQNLDELLETSVLLSSAELTRLDQNRIGLVTISGGDCSLLSDISERAGLNLPNLEGESRETISRELNKDTFIGNPLDIEDLLISNTDGFYRSLEAFFNFPHFAVIGCRLNIPDKPNDRLRQTYRRIAEIASRAGKQLVYFSRASEQIDQEWFDLFSSLKVPFLLEYEKGLRTVRRAIGINKRWDRLPETRDDWKREKKKEEGVLNRICSKRESGPLPFQETLFLFREYGIPFVRTELATSPQEAAELAEAIGYPVVLKVSSVDISHRSDIGAVKAGLKNPQEVRTAYEQILRTCQQARPEARIAGVLVQPAVDAVAEVILGVSRDAQLGPVVLLGTGGIFVEVLKDAVVRVPPLSLEDSREMIEALRGKALFMGARGRPVGDIRALAQAIFSLSRLALDLDEEISEIDLNPVMVLAEGRGVVAVDELVVLTPSGGTAKAGG